MICGKCGSRYGVVSWPRAAAGWHYGTCAICGHIMTVVSAEAFGGLRDGWKEGT